MIFQTNKQKNWNEQAQIQDGTQFSILNFFCVSKLCFIKVCKIKNRIDCMVKKLVTNRNVALGAQANTPNSESVAQVELNANPSVL